MGSNSTLVAPVEIGAARTSQRDRSSPSPCPPEALALGRARQVVKEGWARARRERKRSQ